jgi:anti-anti-sigma factor
MSLHTALPESGGPCRECDTTFQPAPAPAPAPVTLNVDTAGDRLVVTAPGELDLAGGQLLRQTLSEALDHATKGGLELDLADVDFCDCSALNVLLHVRHRARQSARSVVLRASGPAVERLLALSGTLSLFTAGSAEHPPEAHDAPSEAPDSSPEALDSPPEEPEPRARRSDDHLAAENAQLQHALHSHATIDLARGILMASFHLTAEQSWQVLVTASQHSNTKLHVIAEALLETVGGRALPKPLADHLAAAVQTHSGSAS